MLAPGVMAVVDSGRHYTCRAELRSIRANSGAVAWRKLLAHERTGGSDNWEGLNRSYRHRLLDMMTTPPESCSGVLSVLRDIQLLEHRARRIECPVQDQTNEEQRRKTGGEPKAVDDVAEGVAHCADRERRENSR